jgi:hypothetical protein
LSLVRLIRLFFPDWSGTYIVAGCIVAAVEANYSYRLVRTRRLGGADLIRFRATEMAFFLILLRIGSYVGDPWGRVVSDIRSWPQEPRRIFDLEMIYAFLLTLFSWAVSTRTSYDLRRIGEPPVRDRDYVTPTDALVGRFFWGGVLLLWTAGLTRIGISGLFNLGRPSVPGLVGNVLVYFALGLLMLGQIQFSRLFERWRKEGLKRPAGLASHWARYTLILLGLAGLVAFLLPTAYTLPLLDLAGIVLQAVLYAFNVLFYLVMLGLSLLLTPLAALLGGEVRGRPPSPVSPPELHPAMPQGSAPAWFEVVKSLAFWALALGLVFYVVRSYLRDRSELLASLKQLQLVRSVGRLVRGLWRQFAMFLSAARERIPDDLRLPQRRRNVGRLPRGDRFRFFRLGALSRRERMLYYYLSILRRATRHGYPRNQSQTPYEYEVDLQPSVHEAGMELHRLTEAFVEVRYSEREVDKEEEESVRQAWRTVRAALQSLRRRGEGEKTDAEEGE